MASKKTTLKDRLISVIIEVPHVPDTVKWHVNTRKNNVNAVISAVITLNLL